MAVRFVIGRAGTGKTHHCLEAIRGRLRDDPMEGPGLILLVPEQASLQMERAILDSSPKAGKGSAVCAAHRAEVLSFERLAYRVLDATGENERRALSEPARMMVLRHLLIHHAGDLHYYGGLARRAERGGRVGGFLDRLAATIVEFIQEGVEVDSLTALAGNDDDDPSAIEADVAVQRAKLSDLALIYHAYLDYLGSDKLDPSQRLAIAQTQLAECRWLADAELWVDGFASLSGQEIGVLIALARMCPHVDITAMVDPALRVVGGDEANAGDNAYLFARTSQTYRELRGRLIRAGLDVVEPLVLTAEPPPRFAQTPALARLERAVFQGGETAQVVGATPRADVHLVKLPTRHIEVEYAVSRVWEWVRDPAHRYRYRDVAIIVRDLEPYHDLFSQALTARGIPFFVDRRRSVGHHPLVELLRGGVTAAVERMSTSSVRLLLKTGLLSVSDDAADELENYLLAQGISGIEAWRMADWRGRRDLGLDNRGAGPASHQRERLERLNETRRALLGDLDGWLAFAEHRSTRGGAEWAAALIAWLERLDVSARLQSWAAEAEDEGLLEHAEEHRQVWRDVMAFLDDLAFAFAGTSLSTGDLLDVLEAGLSVLTMGLVPPVVDQVLVGSIERSRHPDIKAAVIVGLNDGVFPQKLSEDSILNDDDRERLAVGGLRVRPPMRARVVDETLLAYVAMTRASDELVVTFAAADGDGKPLRESPFIEAIRSGCPGLDEKTLPDPAADAGTWDLLTKRDLAGRMASVFRDPPDRPDEDHSQRRAYWNALYDRIVSEVRGDEPARRSLAGLCERVSVTLSSDAVGRVHASPLRTSVSRLESYARCPFQHFAQYVLGLKEREEISLRPLDIGQVHHAVLEDFVVGLAARGGELSGLSDQELVGGLRASCQRVADRLSTGVMSDARNAYLLRRSATTLVRILRSQRRVAQAGRARPCAAELPFGMAETDGLPAVALTTPEGRSVELRGVIDRVDLVDVGDELFGLVIDYKGTRDKRLRLDGVYYGSSLQLMTYLIALEEFGAKLEGRPVRPAAALYVSLASRYHTVAHPDQDSRETSQGGTYRPRGVISTDVIDAIDDSDAIGWSEHYSVYRLKAGGFAKDCDSADGESFAALLAHTRRKLGELADGVLDGRVAPHPYRLGTHSPCSWCAMKSVCRFETGITEVRFLPSLKRATVLKRLLDDAT